MVRIHLGWETGDAHKDVPKQKCLASILTVNLYSGTFQLSILGIYFWHSALYSFRYFLPLHSDTGKCVKGIVTRLGQSLKSIPDCLHSVFLFGIRITGQHKSKIKIVKFVIWPVLEVTVLSNSF